jgi:PD-(D/E)XK nuclease superfamily protein
VFVSMNPSQQGAIAEAAIALEAIKLGVPVLRPVAEGGRYDLVFELREKLLRIQCKLARRRGDVVVLQARTSRRTRGGYLRTTYSPQEVDAIAGFCPENGRSYLVPITQIPAGGSLSLRLSPSRNNQKVGLHWAADYELGAIAQLGERRYGIPEAAGSSPASSTPKPPTWAALF